MFVGRSPEEAELRGEEMGFGWKDPFKAVGRGVRRFFAGDSNNRAKILFAAIRREKDGPIIGYSAILSRRKMRSFFKGAGRLRWFWAYVKEFRAPTQDQVIAKARDYAKSKGLRVTLVQPDSYWQSKGGFVDPRATISGNDIPPIKIPVNVKVDRITDQDGDLWMAYVVRVGRPVGEALSFGARDIKVMSSLVQNFLNRQGMVAKTTVYSNSARAKIDRPRLITDL